MILHMSALKFICHVFDQAIISFRSFWSDWLPPFLSTRPPIFVSSANFEILLIMSVSKLLIYTIKRMGPRTNPWGIPLVTSDQFEDSPFITTSCCLSFNQFLIQAKRFPLDTMSSKFFEQSYVRYSIECFLEVQVYDIVCFTDIYRSVGVVFLL